ncbi:Cft2 family RNA processing exonuclease [Paenibacillus sp. W4I10]|uniref:MBL fold metallo-hydrolase n=1 Tax=Paenibacillus sp. W4I10 TaxID=3042298 RepID=UPI00277DA08E|nr:MBL fold metallo-hydrolase [Paenibacillus sp. W4I10]MDQ0723143.1 Cft2 family RNA processing exonuclease [Paenibacillus sp. W4I10]
MIKLNVWGGAGEHGRSAYLLSGSWFRLLLDCGVKKEGAGQYPLIDPEIVPQLDAVLLSHAHEDHSVAIPLLYKMGYQGEVWTTRETREQLGTYFRAWRSNMERAGHVIPYDKADEQRIRYRFLENEAERGHWFEIIPGVAAVWGRSGHLAGSVWFGLEMEGKRVLYSGDYTSESMLLQDDDVADGFRRADLNRHSRVWAVPVPIQSLQDMSIAPNVKTDVNSEQVSELVMDQAMGRALVDQSAYAQTLAATGSTGSETAPSSSAVTHSNILTEQMHMRESIEALVSMSNSSQVKLDLAIVDAAYGTDQDTQADKLHQLESAISSVIARGGRVLLPMPAVGRGQEMILWAQQCFQNIPIIVEQKLVDGMTQLHRAPYWLRKGERTRGGLPADSIDHFLSGEGWAKTSTEEERLQLLEQHHASLWFVPDGMMQSSLARWYYERWASDEKNLILLTGHVAAGTFADELLKNPEEYGECEVRKLRYKVHQGWRDVEQMLGRISARHTVLVHTDLVETERLRQGLLDEGSSAEADIYALSPGDELSF